MTRIRMIIQYDGTEYVGWQTQPNGLAVQQVIERELHKLTGEHAALHASGRTDSGVHARAQVAHFDTKSRIPPEKFAYALNAGLPRDIRIAYSDSVPCGGENGENGEYGFHSRYDVKKKHYRYSLWLSPHADPFHRDTALHIHAPLDVDKMKLAAKDILGEHDFAAFKAQGVELESTVRTMYESEWTQSGALLYYDVAGSGFMYNMVRILVGTMIDIGYGRRDCDAVKNALLSKDRKDAGATAPAHGLMLYRVEYESFDTEEHIC